MRTETATWTGDIPGYCDGLVSGEYVFNIPGAGVRTNAGMRPLPGLNSSASFVGIDADGWRYLCQGQDDDRAWLWAGTAWTPVTGLLVDGSVGQLPVYGTDGTIFDAHGVPVVNDTPDKWGATGGLRYLDAAGAIVYCTPTYADPARGLYQFTDFGDVAIGQGHDTISEGAVVWFKYENVNADGTLKPGGPFLRRLAPGTVRNMKPKRSGDRYVVPMCEYSTRTATILWCSLAELRALPPVVVAPIPPKPEPPKPEPPKPEPPKPEPPKPEPPTPQPVPPGQAFPMKDLMEPKTVAFKAGAYVARLVPAPGPSPDVPWPGWFPVKLDRDPVDAFATWTLSQPEAGVNKFRAENVGAPGSILSLDFTQFGGSVCRGVYATATGGGWGQHEQLIGWSLGPDGSPEIVVVNQLDGTTSIGLVVVAL